jgi:hypothetical protein
MEYVLALGVIMVAAVLLTQLLATAAHQRRLGEQRRLALEEVSNRLERAVLLPWDQLTAGIEARCCLSRRALKEVLTITAPRAG